MYDALAISEAHDLANDRTIARNWSRNKVNPVNLRVRVAFCKSSPRDHNSVLIAGRK